jgi:hypothetical protein
LSPAAGLLWGCESRLFIDAENIRYLYKEKMEQCVHKTWMSLLQVKKKRHYSRMEKVHKILVGR